MLIESHSEDVIWLRRTIVQEQNGQRVAEEKEMGRLRGAFVKKDFVLKNLLGEIITLTSCCFTTFSQAGILPGDILVRSDGERQMVLTKKTSSPNVKGSIIRINQYQTKELEYDARCGNI